MDAQLQLGNDAMRIMCCLRLGIPVAGEGQPCDCRIASGTTLEVHALSCPDGEARMARHDHEVRILSAMGEAAGLAVKVEPRAWAAFKDKSGVDLVFFRNTGDPLAVDFSVTSPECGTSLRLGAAERPLAAAVQREFQKVKKHGLAAAKSGWDCMGAAMETTGALGPNLKKLIDEDRKSVV